MNCFAAAMFLLFETWSRTTSGVVQSSGNILGAPVLRHQYFRVHNISGSTCRIGNDLLKDVGELNFVFIAGNVSDVGRAYDVFHRNQWMAP